MPGLACLPLRTPLRAIPVACKRAKQAAQARPEHGTTQGEAGATRNMLLRQGFDSFELPHMVHISRDDSYVVPVNVVEIRYNCTTAA